MGIEKGFKSGTIEKKREYMVRIQNCVVGESSYMHILAERGYVIFKKLFHGFSIGTLEIVLVEFYVKASPTNLTVIV